MKSGRLTYNAQPDSTGPGSTGRLRGTDRRRGERWTSDCNTFAAHSQLRAPPRKTAQFMLMPFVKGAALVMSTGDFSGGQ